MSVLFVGDLHLGHRAIVRLSRGLRPGRTTEEHDDWVMSRLMMMAPTKRTLWYFMGDVSFSPDGLDRLATVPGRKILVKGNHDVFPLADYARVFEDVCGGFKKYGIWLTHMPVHEVELRGRPNLHGHMHYNELSRDPRYLNTAIEWLPQQKPLTLEDVREYFQGQL